MNVGKGRARRPDDWPSSHVRARADLSDRLDGMLGLGEASWLATHLDACPDCRTIADAYASQQLELRGLRDRTPTPPRDLWARTSAAIESESRFRDGRAHSSARRGRRSLAPTALLAAALVVAVAAGMLTSSQHPDSGGTTGSSNDVAVATGSSTNPSPSTLVGATPIPVIRNMAWVSREDGGTFSITRTNVDSVCPKASTKPCDVSTTHEDRPVNLDQNVSTVFGSRDDARLIVVNDALTAKGSTISVVPLESAAPAATPTPTATATASATVRPASIAPRLSPTPTVSPSRTPATSSPTPSAPASVSPSPTASSSPTASVAVTSPPVKGGPIEIAHDVVLVGQSAAYSVDGTWFAFTARPADGSVGPDIFVWKVGDAVAVPVTTDHRSVFGSWSGDVIVGSTVIETTTGVGDAAKVDLEPASFLLDPTSATPTALPQTGRAWRPAVDPSGPRAVYWNGTVRATDGPGYAPEAGRLVLGDWAIDSSAPSDGPLPTPLTGDQAASRHETTIAAGRMDDWDARWDASGTHVAIWIADHQNPLVGRLSLYAVDPFDGKIDLKTPLLESTLATAGYSIADGQLVWAEPDSKGSVSDKIQLLAWTDEGVGTVVSVTGPVIVFR
jgi:hypothetical protein